ncbi:MAG: allantoinase AllB [Terrimicrobiaceae bacterium]
MTADLVIRRGRLPTLRRGPSDVVIVGGRVAGIFLNFRGPATEELDAGGCDVLPGFMDSHVHLNEPGRTSWEGLETGTRALAAGGVTSFFDMPLNSSPAVLTAEDFQRKAKIARKKSLIDFGLWGGLVPGNSGEIAGLAKAGVIGIKAFLCSSGIEDFPAVDARSLVLGAKACAEAGLLLALHAEDPGELEKFAYHAATGKDWRDFVRSRPESCEVEAVRRALQVAEQTGCRLHIVHVSAPGALELIAKARTCGIDVTCETCPHYLLLRDSVMETLGAIAKCSPPLRSPATVSKLWQALKQHKILTIGSDHSPSPPAMKAGRPFLEAWGGINGCQHAMPLFLQAARKRGISWSAISSLLSNEVAHRFALPQKGSIKIGKDADLVILKHTTPEPIQKSGLFTRHPESAYAGMDLAWNVKATIVRGSPVFRDGKHHPNFRGQLLQPNTQNPT